LGAAILYPSLSSLLLLVYLRKYKSHVFIAKLAISLGIILLVNGLGMFTVVAGMADIRYLMMIEMFRGVKVALFVPLLLFAVNYLMIFRDEDSLIQTVYKILLKKPTYLFLCLAGIGLVVVYVSLARSGNNVMGVLQIELRIREQLELLFLARPRFREIIVGYPALLVMVYLYHRYKKNFILLLLGFGVMLGSTSMINSFCHVFTSVYISAHRTLAGLLVGSIIAVCALVAVIILEKLAWYIYRRWFLKGEKADGI
jgi:hypothetical protein